MTREAARQGLTQAVETLVAAYPGGIDIEYPNQVEIDPAQQTSPFMKMKIVWQDSWQASLGPAKHLRAVGMLVLECWVNAGKGTKPSNDILQYFFPTLHMNDTIPGARTHAAKFLPGTQRAGWDVQAVAIPFWFDDIS